MSGTLFLVATPIGNLQDISARALETLGSVSIIGCEDTRHTRKLLSHYKISKKLVSFHTHNEAKRVDEFTEILLNGDDIALVSDAGTPGISDPGYLLVKKAHELGIRVTVIPGAAAFVNAAVLSGLELDSLFFGGFLPSKKGDRRKRLEEVRNIPATLVFYESPHRLLPALNDCLELYGNRKAAIVRELTKLHEEVISSDLAKLADHFSSVEQKGEFVIVIGRHSEQDAVPVSAEVDLARMVNDLLGQGMDRRSALKTAAKELGLTRSEAYRRLQTLE